MSKLQTVSYTLVLEPFEERGLRGYNVSVPALPGCHTWGSSRDEAIAMARDAITQYLAVLREDGRAIPTEGAEKVTTEEISVPVPA